jgi:uncharacterized protein YijF (DUF1287 family)
MDFDKTYGMDGLMITAAIRYCIGRRTYIVGVCTDWIIANWDDWPENVKTIIQRDLDQEFERAAQKSDWKPLGDDCDKRDWEKVRALWGNKP